MAFRNCSDKAKAGIMAHLDDKLTPVTPAEVLEALGKSWQIEFGSPAHRTSLLVLLSQWALETGRGKSMHCYNLGNVKSNQTTGDWCFFRCNEVINGKVVWFDPDHPACCFRAFTNLNDGALDYLRVLHTRFSKAWPAVESGDPALFSHLLKANHYYTADEGQYTKTLVALFNEFSRTLQVQSNPTKVPDLYSGVGIQTVLKALNFDPGTIDGIDGPNTRAAVKHFQLAHGLVSDGIVGPLTRAALSKAWAMHNATAG
jgi:Putative peptidoglycan binding domain